MYICIINDWATPRGGADEVAISSACGLADVGHEVVFIHGAGGVDARLIKAGVRCSSLDRIPIKTVLNVGAILRGLCDFSVLFRLITILRATPAGTVVHVHAWHETLSVAAFWAPLLAGRSLVTTLHDYLLACPNGTLYDYPANRICHRLPMSPACICRNCDRRSYVNKLWRVVRQFILKYIVGVPSFLAAGNAISGMQVRVIAPLVGLGSRLSIVQNPIRAFAGSPPPPPADARRGFVFVGRLGFEKGPDIAARVCGHIGAELMIVGDGDLRDRLTCYGPGIKMLGWQSREGVVEAMRSARALIFPSRWLETFGLTPIEALAVGTPVVVSKNAAAADFIVNGVDGYVFDPNDETELARVLAHLQNDAKLSELLRKVDERRPRWANAEENHAVTLSRIYGSLRARREVI
jgi:glycosyltransferase involved in cell wall biosynthesis